MRTLRRSHKSPRPIHSRRPRVYRVRVSGEPETRAGTLRHGVVVADPKPHVKVLPICANASSSGSEETACDFTIPPVSPSPQRSHSDMRPRNLPCPHKAANYWRPRHGRTDQVQNCYLRVASRWHYRECEIVCRKVGSVSNTLMGRLLTLESRFEGIVNCNCCALTKVVGRNWNNAAAVPASQAVLSKIASVDRYHRTACSHRSLCRRPGTTSPDIPTLARRKPRPVVCWG